MNEIKKNKHYTKEVILSSIFKAHFDTLYNYGMKISNNSEMVKDSIQEIFYRIWKNNIDFSTISNVRAYLLKSLRRQIINIYELKHNQVNKTEINENISIEFSPEDYFIQNQAEEELRNRILKELNSLSNKQREAIYLRYFEELEYDDIAEIMGIKLQSAKNTVQRALESLRGTFSPLLFLYLFGKIIQ